MRLKKSVAISESGFIFNAERGDSFSVNGIGMDILAQMKADVTEADIQGYLLSRYDIDPDTCEKDVYDFIKVLNRYNMLEL
ncbi:MAG: PqqD family protein [Bacteroidetes bacterium]|nr:PqqD family protein [Bacteroidota bacterium]